MNKCTVCGHESHDSAVKCPKCGHFYSRITQIIDEQAAQDELQTLRGRVRRILNAEHVKDELRAEWQRIKAELGKKGLFALFVIFVFVFALVVSVL